MNTLKSLRQTAWAFEFDQADDEAQDWAHRQERVRRCAMSRQTCAAGTALPSQKRQPESRPSGEVKPWVPDLSRHGRIRLQQRGISMDQVLAVANFGREQRSHGASRFFLDKRTRQLLAVEMPDAMRTLNRLDIQVVLSDDDVLITAAHRTQRVRRDIQRRRRSGAAH